MDVLSIVVTTWLGRYARLNSIFSKFTLFGLWIGHRFDFCQDRSDYINLNGDMTCTVLSCGEEWFRFIDMQTCMGGDAYFAAVWLLLFNISILEKAGNLKGWSVSQSVSVSFIDKVINTFCVLCFRMALNLKNMVQNSYLTTLNITYSSFYLNNF